MLHAVQHDKFNFMGECGEAGLVGCRNEFGITVSFVTYTAELPRSADKLRAKTGQNMMASALVGALANLAEAGACANEVAARFSSPWFCSVLQGKGHVRQRSISDDKRFGYFAATK